MKRNEARLNAFLKANGNAETSNVGINAFTEMYAGYLQEKIFDTQAELDPLFVIGYLKALNDILNSDEILMA